MKGKIFKGPLMFTTSSMHFVLQGFLNQDAYGGAGALNLQSIIPIGYYVPENNPCKYGAVMLLETQGLNTCTRVFCRLHTSI